MYSAYYKEYHHCYIMKGDDKLEKELIFSCWVSWLEFIESKKYHKEASYYRTNKPLNGTVYVYPKGFNNWVCSTEYLLNTGKITEKTKNSLDRMPFLFNWPYETQVTGGFPGYTELKIGSLD